MKHRLERINEIIRRELSEIVRREVVFSAPLVTLQSADISPDLKTCHIYVSVIGNEVQKQEAIARLLDKRKDLQHLLMKRIVLKYTPQLHFDIDHSLERGDRIMQILDEIVLPPDDPN
ncbi:MAG: 30S ribosome-binding factor RbfA [Chthoniobacteraceae bacterium]|jgi:ribosome-binding factor A